MPITGHENSPERNSDGLLGEGRLPGPLGIERKKNNIDLKELKKLSDKQDTEKELVYAPAKPEDTTIVEPFPAEAQQHIATQIQRVVPEVVKDKKPRDPKDTIRYGEY